MTTSGYEPSKFETELLTSLAREQARFERGEWKASGTLWSRVSYLMAKRRGATLPSPVPRLHNINDEFRSRFHRAVSRLISAGLVRQRSIRPAAPHPNYIPGYHRHNVRDQDIFLSAAGQAWVDARSKPTVASITCTWDVASCSNPPFSAANEMHPSPKREAGPQPSTSAGSGFVVTLNREDDES